MGKKFFLDRAGICLLLFLAFAAGFSKWLSDNAFAVLFFIFLVRLTSWAQAKGGVCPLPKIYLWSQLVFALTWIFLVNISPDPLPGVKYLAAVLYTMAIFPITVLWAREERYRRLILPLLAAGFIVAALIASYQAWPDMACVRVRVLMGIMKYGGILGLLSIFWAALALMAWQEQNRPLAGLYFLAFWAGLWGQTLNCTRISILETIAGAIIFFVLTIRRFNWRFFLIILLSLSLFFFYSSQRPEMAARLVSISDTKTDFSNTMRLTMWSHGWEVFKEHPVAGAGIQNLPKLIFSDGGATCLGPEDKMPREYDHPEEIIRAAHLHNVFLDIMAQGGSLGLLSYLALYFPFIFLACRGLKSSDTRIRSWSVLILVLIGEYFTHSMTDQIFGMNPLMYIFWMLMGLAYLQIQPDSRHAAAAEDAGGKN